MINTQITTLISDTVPTRVLPRRNERKWLRILKSKLNAMSEQSKHRIVDLLVDAAFNAAGVHIRDARLCVELLDHADRLVRLTMSDEEKEYADA